MFEFSSFMSLGLCGCESFYTFLTYQVGAVLLTSNLTQWQKHFCKVSEILWEPHTAALLTWVFQPCCNGAASLSAFEIVHHFGIELH